MSKPIHSNWRLGLENMRLLLDYADSHEWNIPPNWHSALLSKIFGRDR